MAVGEKVRGVAVECDNSDLVADPEWMLPGLQ
jgi:hypothetical protein